MFCDTHCHLFSYYSEETVKELLKGLTSEFSFVQDIGTKPDDFSSRITLAQKLLSKIPESFYFALGIWPESEYIASCEASVNTLEKSILQAKEMGLKVTLGECGLDRFWNGPNALTNNRGTTDIYGEEKLFEEQLRLAKKYNLAVIVHGRDAFEDTLKVIDKVGYHKGVIHCYAYGKEEAKAFLERGWYISFSGNCTFPSTNKKKEQMALLVESVPNERLLLETDAPFLAPVPHRGKENTPLLIKHVYDCVANIRATSVEQLCHLVKENAERVFS